MVDLAVYTSKYADVYYNSDFRMLEFHWKVTTEEMTDQEYRFITFDVMSILTQKLKKEVDVLENYLLDNRLFLYEIPQDTQVWQRDYIFKPLIELGGKKVAVVMSEAYLSQHLIEQTFRVSQETNLITRYFDNVEEAKKWLSAS